LSTLLFMLRKDLRRDVRAPLGILLMLAFPLVFALMLGVTFGGGSSSVPRVRLLVEDRDGELAARALLSAFSAEQTARYFDVTEVGEDGREAMERGEASALLTIPEGFTRDLLEGRRTTLALVRNPAQQILPEIAEQLATVLAEVLSAGSYALREPLDELSGMVDAGSEPSDASIAALSVAFRHAVERSSEYVFPPAITLEAVDFEAPGDESRELGRWFVFLMVLPGVSVFGLFMLGDQVMRDILTEEREGTLRRQLAAPMGLGRIVAGKVLHTGVVASISLVILSVAGWVLTRRALDLVAFVMLSAALIVLVTGAAATVYGIARNERQGATLASVVYLVLAFSGGSFFQVEGLPPLLRALSPYTPFRWANDGFRALIEGGTLAEVLPQIGLLAGLGLVLLIVGSRLLGRRLLRGATA